MRFPSYVMLALAWAIAVASAPGPVLAEVSGPPIPHELVAEEPPLPIPPIPPKKIPPRKRTAAKGPFLVDTGRWDVAE